MSNHQLLLRIQTALIEATTPSRKVTNVPGFVVMLDPTDPMIWINYAVPTSQCETSHVQDMVQVFKEADRTPRLEFFLDLWPDTAPMLEAQGFECEKRMPIMVLQRGEWNGLQHLHDVEPVTAETFHQMNHVLQGAFGVATELGTGDPFENSDFIRIHEGHTLATIAKVGGEVVGGGLGVGTKEIREIAGIGTKESFRKQGIASAVIANLLNRFFAEDGEIAWLTPGDDTAQSVYTNLGFKTIAQQVCYSLNSSEAR